MTVRVLAAALLYALVCSCGGPSANSASQAPDEATLCALELGASTLDDAVALLGAPTTRTDRDTRRTLLYRFGDAFVSLHFDERLIFVQATTIELPFPSCWRIATAPEQS